VATKNFVQTFHGAIDQLEADAKKEGLTLTSICRDTGVSRATPDRWRKKIPKTIELLGQMQDIVAAKRESNEKEAADALHQD
jgi:hypothetical protein